METSSSSRRVAINVTSSGVQRSNLDDVVAPIGGYAGGRVVTVALRLGSVVLGHYIDTYHLWVPHIRATDITVI